jgi:hypothetical protein
MASTDNPSIGPQCSDSPLSITGNVLGILTFALGLLASALAFLVITSGIQSELSTLELSLEKTGHQISHSRRYFQLRDSERDAILQEMGGEIAAALNSAERLYIELLGSVRTVKESADSVWTRVGWWYHGRQAVTANMARLESEKTHLGTLQLTFLLK